MDLPARSAQVHRETSETSVSVELNLDTKPTCESDTGIGFLDHMLDLFSRHGRFGMKVVCDGDLYIDDHHSVEDTGITLGRAFREALGDKEYITRYGHAYVPMDDVLVRAVVDLSGRFYFHCEANFERDRVGDLSTEMVRHFWYSFAEHARCNLHVEVLYGHNTHHQIEGIFKAVTRALRQAVRRDPAHGRVASTKGTL